MTTANLVFSGPASNVAPLNRSAILASGVTALPGMLLELNASKEFILHNSAGEGGDLYIADMNIIEQKNATTALTAGDMVKGFVPEVGCTYNLVLAAAQTITVGEALASNGDGSVKSATLGTATPDVALFVAEEDLTTTGSTGRIRARFINSALKAAS